MWPPRIKRRRSGLGPLHMYSLARAPPPVRARSATKSLHSPPPPFLINSPRSTVLVVDFPASSTAASRHWLLRRLSRLSTTHRMQDPGPAGSEGQRGFPLKKLLQNQDICSPHKHEETTKQLMSKHMSRPLQHGMAMYHMMGSVLFMAKTEFLKGCNITEALTSDEGWFEDEVHQHRMID